jgi:acetyl-CoA carboxylase biotin carboxyl carrier protein
MDEKQIRSYASLMSELGLSGLEIQENGSKLRLERGCAPAGTPAAPQAGTERAPAEDAGAEIRSPMVGVFYASPAENARPYAEVGSRIKKGDVVCIIEAMKLMNEITSDKDGVVAEVCAADGEVVDYGRTLFRLRREQ